MLKIVNKKENILDEVICGIMEAQPDEFIRMQNLYSYTLHRKNIKNNRVQIVINGGGGYGPLFPGFVGEGLADAMCHGDFDCAPNAYALYEVAKKINTGKGILLITNNFAGDFLNNDMAQELLTAEGIESKVCYVSDDIFSAKGEDKVQRGGLSGIGTLTKIASKAANLGMDLEGVFRIVNKANDRLRTATIIVNEEKNLMELGAGFSGEAPVIVNDFVSALDMVDKASEYLINELKDYQTSKLYFSINRMSRMTYAEGYIVLNSLKKVLINRGYEISGCAVGSYFDAFDSNGCIISILGLDEELEKYIERVSGYDFTI